VHFCPVPERSAKPAGYTIARTEDPERENTPLAQDKFSLFQQQDRASLTQEDRASLSQEDRNVLRERVERVLSDVNPANQTVNQVSCRLTDD
jgi:hypothetical protein